MNKLPLQRQTIDMATGKVTETKEVHATLMPPAAHLCQTCAVDHPEEAPHNRDSLYYQMVFFGNVGRWPTWADAMSHRPPHIKLVWTQLLTKKGVNIDE